MGMPGMPELILIFGVVILLFGGKKLPALGGAIGESIRNFKKGVKEMDTPTPTPTLTAESKSPDEKEAS